MGKPMQSQEVQRVLAELAEQYDLVRLVNPEECYSFQMEKDNRISYGKDCYEVWRSTNRCRNCTSLRALKTGAELHKTEIKDGDLYEITSRPIEILRDDTTSYSCVIEMIRIHKGAGLKKDQHHPVMREDVPPAYFSATMKMVMQNFPYGVVMLDLHGSCIYANSEAFRIFQLKDDLQVLSRILHDWIPQDMLKDLCVSNWMQNYEMPRETKSIAIDRYPLQDADGNISGIYLILHDCTQAQKNIELEHFGSLHDNLTGIFNRYGFYRQARKCLETYPDEDYCLAGINFCDFKLINSLYSLTKGNELLVRLGNMLRHAYEDDQKVVYGRIQDDRFAVLIPQRKFRPEVLLRDVENLMQDVRPGKIVLQVLIGICKVEDTSMPISILCDRAFMAANFLKRQENSAFAWYKKDMLANQLRDRAILSRFADAMQHDELQIYLQAQVSADDGHVIGAEALSRWRREDGAMISPALFIPVLEEHGKIWQLDHWVWEQSCRLLKRWQSTPFADYAISVNISVKDMYYLDLYEVFTGLVKKYEIDPSKLRLEITETVFMDKPEEAMRLIRKLQEYGFYVAIDDFGSGYSSLRLLKDIQADILKIDMEFLHKTDHHLRSRIILQSIVSMAQALKMPTVVEGVETSEQADYLRSIGCTYFQGYYFSQPVPVAEFETRTQEKLEKGNK